MHNYSACAAKSICFNTYNEGYNSAKRAEYKSISKKGTETRKGGEGIVNGAEPEQVSELVNK